jgi:hypothetical protein
VLAADVRRAGKTAAALAPAGRVLLPAGWKLGAGVGVLAAEGAAGYLDPVVGAGLAVADVLAPLAIALILLSAILRGSTETCERAFRLLRWLAGRPEPPAPLTQGPGAAARQRSQAAPPPSIHT